MPEKQNSYDREAILRCAQGELFGADNTRLPLPNMLMFDRIDLIDESGGRHGRGFVQASLDVKPDMWFFHCHFPGDPVMPGCLGLDALWQLVGFYLAWQGHKGKGRALGVNEVKFAGQILPTAKKVTYEIHIKRVIVRKLVMGIADGVVIVDGEEIYHAGHLRVGLFSAPSQF